MLWTLDRTETSTDAHTNGLPIEIIVTTDPNKISSYSLDNRYANDSVIIASP